MQILPNYPEERKSDSQPASAKGKFLILCAVMSAVYLVFSFAMSAHADPPTSPYTPGETLNPTCVPGAPNCTVDPPLFSTTTLPMGGILYMNDTSGTVTAATTSLYWNAVTPQLQIGATPALTPTGTLLLLGPNQLAIPSGHPTGTWFGINQSTSTGSDFLNFETNSSTELQVSSSGAVTANLLQINSDFNLGTSTNPVADIFYIATSSPIFAINYNGTINAGGAFNASGTITQNGTPVLTTSTIATSTAGVSNALPIWTSASTLGNSFISELTAANATSVIINFNTSGLPTTAATSSFLYLGGNTLIGGSASGTYLGINTVTPFNGDFENFEVNSSTKFRINASGSLIIATGTAAANALFTIATSSPIFSVLTTGRVGIGTGAPTSPLQIASLSGQTASSTDLLLGPNVINGGNTAGTFIGANPSTGYTGDFENFQVNSSTVFDVTGAGALTLGSAVDTSILYANGSGQVGALGIGSGLSLSGGTLSATGGSGGGVLSSGLSFSTTTLAYSEQLDSTSTVVMVQATVASTSVYKYTVPGNTLGTNGAFIQVSMFGTLRVPTTHSLGLLMYYGGQLVASTTSANVVVSANNSAPWSATFDLSNASGTTNNQIGTVSAILGAGTGGASISAIGNGTSSVASTGANTLEIDLRLAATTAESSTVNSVQTQLFGATTTVVTGITGGVGTAATSSNFYFPYYTSTSTLSATSTLFISSSTGNISVGTTTTSASLLYVNGKVTATGGFNGQCLSSGGFNGTSSASCNMDLAESYPTLEPTEAGDVVAIPKDGSSTDGTDTSPDGVTALQKSRGGSDETVIGVVSTNPGLVFDNGSTYLSGANDDLTTSTEAVVALAGRVPVNVSASNGPIEPGDLLAASTITPGVAVLAVGPGTVIGEALQAYTGPDDPNATSTPQILVFINPHWAPGNDGSDAGAFQVPGENSSSGDASAIAQVVQYLEAALAQLGVVISNGVETLQGVIAQKVTTNELCVQGTCVNGSQFSAMMNGNGNTNGNANTNTSANTNSNASGNANINTPADNNSGTGSANAPVTPPASSTPTSTPSSTPPILPTPTSTTESSSIPVVASTTPSLPSPTSTPPVTPPPPPSPTSTPVTVIETSTVAATPQPPAPNPSASSTPSGS